MQQGVLQLEEIRAARDRLQKQVAAEAQRLQVVEALSREELKRDGRWNASAPRWIWNLRRRSDL